MVEAGGNCGASCGFSARDNRAMAAMPVTVRPLRSDKRVSMNSTVKSTGSYSHRRKFRQDPELTSRESFSAGRFVHILHRSLASPPHQDHRSAVWDPTSELNERMANRWS